VTLNLTIVNKFGAWQCSDHRLTIKGASTSNASIKQVQLHCHNGTALIAYTGLGQIDDVTISDWIVETLRGESRSIDECLILLRLLTCAHMEPFRLRPNGASRFAA